MGKRPRSPESCKRMTRPPLTTEELTETAHAHDSESAPAPDLDLQPLRILLDRANGTVEYSAGRACLDSVAAALAARFPLEAWRLGYAAAQNEIAAVKRERDPSCTKCFFFSRETDTCLGPHPTNGIVVDAPAHFHCSLFQKAQSE